jgi:hypothetical protein
VLLAVLAPCAVGAVMFVVVDALQRALRRRRPDEAPPDIDFMI